jgi:hypothetical protein
MQKFWLLVTLINLGEAINSAITATNLSESQNA